MVSRNDIVQYLVDQYYDGDAGKAAKATGRTKQQVQGWLNRTHQPHQNNVSQLLFYAVVPEFKVITEFTLFRGPTARVKLRGRLARILKGHEYASGLYAFYDSMANLIYLGKSDGNLLAECYQQIKARIPARTLPKSIGATQRFDVVRYISAYSVPPPNTPTTRSMWKV